MLYVKLWYEEEVKTNTWIISKFFMMDGKNYEVFKYKGKGFLSLYFFNLMITKLANKVIYIWRCWNERNNPAVILWELAYKEHSKLKSSVFISSMGVIAGIVPYIGVSRILVNLLNGIEESKVYLLWLGIGLLSYILKSILYFLALSVSQKATFSVLKDIRLRMLDKLPKMPLV